MHSPGDKREASHFGGLSLLPKKRSNHQNHFCSEGNPHRAGALLGKVVKMRREYDFSKAQRNPYASRLKRQITIRMDEDTISYFKQLAQDIGIPYQTLINLYLRDCAASQKKLSLQWKPA